jgi:hypothetical protein
MDSGDDLSDLEGGDASGGEDGSMHSQASVACMDSDNDGHGSLPSSELEGSVSESSSEAGGSSEEEGAPLDELDEAGPPPERISVQETVSDLESLGRCLPRLWQEGLLEGVQPCMHGFSSFVQSLKLEGGSLLASDPGKLAEGLDALRSLRKELCRRQLCSPPPALQRGGKDAGPRELQEAVAFLLRLVAVEKTKASVQKLKSAPRQEDAWVASLRLESELAAPRQRAGAVERCLEIMKPTAKELERLGFAPERPLAPWLEGGGAALEALRTWRCLRFTGVPSFRSLLWASARAERGALQGTRLGEPQDFACFVEACWELMGLTPSEQGLLGCTKVTARLASEWLSRGTFSSHLQEWSRARFL